MIGHQRRSLHLVLGALAAFTATPQAWGKEQQKMVHQKDTEHPHKWIAGPPTEIDCSVASSNFEYYIERCHDEITQWWVNGHCVDGVKTEVSELHRCQRSSGDRPYCHDCYDGRGNSKHVCGSNSPDINLVCPVTLSSNPQQDCPDDILGSTAWSHQCTSKQTSMYLHESLYCDEKEVHHNGRDDVYTCGREWYYPFREGDIDESTLAANPELRGEEHPFSTPSSKYCLECGIAIQVCVSDPDATCVHLGLPMKGFDKLPDAEVDNSRYEGGER